MTTPFRIAAAGALALALAACGEKAKPDPFLQNVPEVAALTIETSASASAVVSGATIDPALPVSSLENDLGVVHQKAQAMNEALRGVFAHVEAITSSGGRLLAGDVKEWGPANRCVQPDGAGGCMANGTATLVLRVRRWSDRVADFVVLARAPAATLPTDLKPVLAGYLIRGPMERRGAGRIWVNHPNLKAAASDFKGTGFLAAGFAAGPVAKAVTYRMSAFSRDPGAHEPVWAAFSAWKSAAGVVRARVAGFADLDKTGAADELGLWRGVWAPALGGRAFTVVTNFLDPRASGTPSGDVPAGKYWFGRACYPPGQTLPSFKEWFLCDRFRTELVNGTPTQVPNTPVACVIANLGAGAIDAGVPTAFASWQETSCHWNPAQHGGQPEPEHLRPPGREPRDENDDRDEDGAAGVGLMPEPCPTTVDASNPDRTPPGMGGGMAGGMSGVE